MKREYSIGYSKGADREGELSPDRPAASRVATRSLVVRPPIPQVGPGFTEAVLGQGAEGVALTHVVTTKDMTVFNVETSNERGGEYSLGAVAARMGALLREPERAPVLLEQSFYDYDTYRQEAGLEPLSE